MKLLRKYIYIIGVAIVAIITTAADKNASSIAFDSRSYDFGIIREDGGPVKCSFRFTNTGDAPLVIISANASCGCTRPSYPKDPIKPGKSGEIKVSYLPAGRPGSFSKVIKVRTNDPRNKKINLKISGTVTPAEKADKD